MIGLTETKLQEMLEDSKRTEHQPTIMLGAKQLALLKAKYPEIYDKPYKCSWQRMLEQLTIK
jgi:hypothetical protein